MTCYPQLTTSPFKTNLSVQTYTTSTATLTVQHRMCHAPPPSTSISTSTSSSTPYRTPAPPVLANIDVTLLLSTLAPTDLQVGEWINIIGYVSLPPTPPPPPPPSPPQNQAEKRNSGKGKRHQQREGGTGADDGVVGTSKLRQSQSQSQKQSHGTTVVTAHVQAIMIWSAGAIDVGEYERALKARENIMGDR
ncbi:MAG: hypothetical protein M1837_003886 [Sclerophora amabilis]|nr:MAG: hypothetical protein M1837_003886 [Sclerophora amabilis]